MPSNSAHRRRYGHVKDFGSAGSSERFASAGGILIVIQSPKRVVPEFVAEIARSEHLLHQSRGISESRCFTGGISYARDHAISANSCGGSLAKRGDDCERRPLCISLDSSQVAVVVSDSYEPILRIVVKDEACRPGPGIQRAHVTTLRVEDVYLRTILCADNCFTDIQSLECTHQFTETPSAGTDVHAPVIGNAEV